MTLSKSFNLAAVLFTGALALTPAAEAQDAEREQELEQERAMEVLRREEERTMRVMEQLRREEERLARMEDRELVQIEREQARLEMREAEARLAEAARRIADLSQLNLPAEAFVQAQSFVVDGRPRLGVTVDGSSDEGPVDGVSLSAVTPGSAAGEAGLRAGDVMTSIDGQALSAASSQEAGERLVEFMETVEEGQTLRIEYLRDGKAGSVEVTPRPLEPRVFAFRGQPGGDFDIIGDTADIELLIDPDSRESVHFEFGTGLGTGAFGSLEMIELNEGLGRYFGTDSGLLIVSAPEDNDLQVQDGDVIKSVDGREPQSVSHAMRILGSYESGEELELDIMRDKRKRTLKIVMPEREKNYFFFPQPPASPAPAPTPTPAPTPGQR